MYAPPWTKTCECNEKLQREKSDVGHDDEELRRENAQLHDMNDKQAEKIAQLNRDIGLYEDMIINLEEKEKQTN